MNSKMRIFALIGILVVTYIMLMSFSFRGWGYPGYRGYHRGGSFLYMGGPRHYHSGRSVRGGSVGGTRALGGGPGGGK